MAPMCRQFWFKSMETLQFELFLAIITLITLGQETNLKPILNYPIQDLDSSSSKNIVSFTRVTNVVSDSRHTVIWDIAWTTTSGMVTNGLGICILVLIEINVSWKWLQSFNNYENLSVCTIRKSVICFRSLILWPCVIFTQGKLIRIYYFNAVQSKIKNKNITYI